MKEYFHPRDKSNKAMFYRAHDQMMDKLKTFAEIQASNNPLTDDERRALATKYPERYGFMLPKLRQVLSIALLALLVLGSTAEARGGGGGHHAYGAHGGSHGGRGR